ncbi:MAG: site-specific tyrosine recombinase/integron integrase [Rikenellaceae bacterium]
MLDIKEELLEYKTYLVLEKNLSANSVDAYMRDIVEFLNFYTGAVELITIQDIEKYITHLHHSQKQPSSTARMISGVKSFFNYLYIYDKIETLPTELIESPKLERKIPSYLTMSEVEAIINSIDLSQPLAHRNRAIIELLYGCGLRVSELVGLRMIDLFFDDSFIKVIGKGDKQRLVPVGNHVIKAVELWRIERQKLGSTTKARPYLFLNRRGGVLSRVMVFNIVKELGVKAGIKKKISPHTFRHTYASLLVKGGADIRAVQQILGHESILTTEIYTHIDTSQKRESIDKLFSDK